MRHGARHVGFLLNDVAGYSSQSDDGRSRMEPKLAEALTVSMFSSERD